MELCDEFRACPIKRLTMVCFLSIDLDKHHVRDTHRKAPKSENVYLKLLVKVFRFLARKS